MEENKKKEEEQQKKRSSIRINPVELIVQSIWNAVTWLPAILLSSFLDDD